MITPETLAELRCRLAAWTDARDALERLREARRADDLDWAAFWHQESVEHQGATEAWLELARAALPHLPALLDAAERQEPFR